MDANFGESERNEEAGTETIESMNVSSSPGMPNPAVDVFASITRPEPIRRLPLKFQDYVL